MHWSKNCRGVGDECRSDRRAHRGSRANNVGECAERLRGTRPARCRDAYYGRSRRRSRNALNIIERALAQEPRPQGFVGAHLVELSTGQVLAGLTAATGEGGSVGADTADPARALAGVLPDNLQKLATVLAVHSTAEDLEDLVVTTSRHHHLVTLLLDLGGSD